MNEKASYPPFLPLIPNLLPLLENNPEYANALLGVLRTNGFLILPRIRWLDKTTG